MITFDLACNQHHRFEGWFRNREDFDAQLAGGLIACPLCGSSRVEKQLSAVSVHVGRRSAPALPPPAAPSGNQSGHPAAAPSATAASGPRSPGVPAQPFFQALTQFLETQFEDVGSRFADEARKVESGEAVARNIRGTTTPEEEAELREEGVEFLKVAVPKYDA
ncbi:MAG TPA: DUF1178 family protein [Deferrisomatales bacterium]|nr:DUF1178 family protein [Deferrisomatales bacterium]